MANKKISFEVTEEIYKAIENLMNDVKRINMTNANDVNEFVKEQMIFSAQKMNSFDYDSLKKIVGNVGDLDIGDMLESFKDVFGGNKETTSKPKEEEIKPTVNKEYKS